MAIAEEFRKVHDVAYHFLLPTYCLLPTTYD